MDRPGGFVYNGAQSGRPSGKLGQGSVQRRLRRVQMARHTIRGCLACLATLAVVMVLLELAPASLAGQAPATAAKAGSTLRTPWGEPDLQGIWIRDSDTP